MHLTAILSALSAASVASSAATFGSPTATDVNPFLNRNYFANSHYAGELNQTYNAFKARNETLNAARVRTVQQTGTFVWVTSVSGLSSINTTIAEARTAQRETRTPQIVQLVLYDLPDRDCSAGESAGEFNLQDNGLELYKHTFVDPYAAALKAAPDLTFAVILEPDSLGNVVTNQAVPLCANATSGYEEGIAYAIAKLQAPNVALYIDAAHGGWLGWDANLPLGCSSSSPPSFWLIDGKQLQQNSPKSSLSPRIFQQVLPPKSAVSAPTSQTSTRISPTPAPTTPNITTLTMSSTTPKSSPPSYPTYPFPPTSSSTRAVQGSKTLAQIGVNGAMFWPGLAFLRLRTQIARTWIVLFGRSREGSQMARVDRILMVRRRRMRECGGRRTRRSWL
jgi:hypothetical protein